MLMTSPVSNIPAARKLQTPLSHSLQWPLPSLLCKATPIRRPTIDPELKKGKIKKIWIVNGYLEHALCSLCDPQLSERMLHITPSSSIRAGLHPIEENVSNIGEYKGINSTYWWNNKNSQNKKQMSMKNLSNTWGASHDKDCENQGEQEWGGQNTCDENQAHPPPGVQHFQGNSNLCIRKSNQPDAANIGLTDKQNSYQSHHHCVCCDMPEASVNKAVAKVAPNLWSE